VTIIAIGVGSADEKELKDMATDDSHVFMLQQYTYLKDKLNNMLKLACQSGNLFNSNTNILHVHTFRHSER